MGNDTSLGEFKIQKWCNNKLHKWFYGSSIKETKIGGFEITEYFCKRCGKKTGGYTHFELPKIELIKNK